MELEDGWDEGGKLSTKSEGWGELVVETNVESITTSGAVEENGGIGEGARRWCCCSWKCWRWC